MEKSQDLTAPRPPSHKTGALPTKLFLFDPAGITTYLTVWNLRIPEPSPVIDCYFLTEDQDFLTATLNFQSAKDPQTMLDLLSLRPTVACTVPTRNSIILMDCIRQGTIIEIDVRTYKILRKYTNIETQARLRPVIDPSRQSLWGTDGAGKITHIC